MIIDCLWIITSIISNIYYLYDYFWREFKNVCYELDLYDWDENILNHDFSDPKMNMIEMRKCKKCNIDVHHNPISNRYNTFNPIMRGETYPTLTLTCEEYIIKNIIE